MSSSPLNDDGWPVSTSSSVVDDLSGGETGANITKSLI